jgi:hypothetical protein
MFLVGRHCLKYVSGIYLFTGSQRIQSVQWHLKTSRNCTETHKFEVSEEASTYLEMGGTGCRLHESYIIFHPVLCRPNLSGRLAIFAYAFASG